ncbi:winged helix-turn-helix domain-containing protein [Cellulomonas bogoriensis]|nr:crosslink repair DNA glycosylase YcaQ family protein [Cellulomonas bogoriensis]
MAAPLRAPLTRSQARRIALRAQGLDGPPVDGGPSVTSRHLARTVGRTGLLQIDSVNVLARAHLVPLYSRLGAYDVAALDRLTAAPSRRLLEAWAHEASFVPPSVYALLAWRRRAWARRRLVLRDVDLEASGAVARVRDLVDSDGPLTSRQVHAALGPPGGDRRGSTGWWEWSTAKAVLEWLFATGELAVARRTPSFERVYDLAGRVLPQAARAEPDAQTAVHELVRLAARAHGLGTVRCFADYFRLAGTGTRRWVREAVAALVADGELEPVDVAGWDREVYLDSRAVVPRRAQGRTFLSPFDPVVFERRRLSELFGTEYRIEIYTPAHLRVHGYYCLPLLLGEELVARVDLRLDRPTGVLQVRSAHPEPGVSAGAGEVTGALVAELGRLAGWLGAGEVAVDVGAGGALAHPVRRALTAGGGGGVRSGSAVTITAGPGLAYDGRRSVSTAPSGAPGPVDPSPSGAGL